MNKTEKQCQNKVSDVLYLIPQLLDYFLTIISLERSMWEGPKRIIWHWDQNFICSVFFTTDMFLFCKTILYSRNCRIFRDLAFGSIKTRFKAILKKLFFLPRSTFRPIIIFLMNFCPRRATFRPRFTFFMNLCPRRATIRYEAYNVFTFLIYIYNY